jgi:hypothetical protein
MKKKLLTLIFLSFTVYASANFTLVGTTIRQTGTDTNLSGLAGIAGVNTLQKGSDGAAYTIYDIGNLQLVVEGTLTIDASKEMLLIGPTAPRNIITVNGILNINDFETLNGFTIYRQRTAIRTTYDNNDCCNNFSLEVIDSGTLNMQGGGIEASSSIQFTANSNINIKDGRIELLSNTPHPDYQIRQYSNNLIANGLQLNKYALTMIGTPIQFDNYIPTIADEGINFSVNSSDIEYVFRNYSGGGRGNRLDLGLWRNKKGKVINSLDGTNVIIQEHKVGDGNSTGTWQITKEIAPKIVDENANPIQNTKMFIRDTNNGNRTNGNGYNFTDDRTYFQTSNAFGLMPTTEVLTGAVNHLSASGSVQFDRRSKNNNSNDEFDILFYHYNKVLSKSTQKLKGNGVLTFDWTMFTDNNITETNPTVVAAYSSIENLGQLYDYAKYWKQLNQTNIEIPSVDKLLIVNESSLLDLGDYNLIVDANATSVFSVDTSTKTITIKSNTILTTSKYIGIKTTATISVVNGASLEHGFIDSTGTNKFVNLKWNQNTQNDLTIINKDDLSIIYGTATPTATFKDHFLVPTPIPTNGIEVQIDILNNGPNLYIGIIPNEDLNFVRLDIDLIDLGTELNQLEILRILERLLAKIESINNAMDNSPATTLIINKTITNTLAEATLENQLVILEILNRIFKKVTAARESLKND